MGRCFRWVRIWPSAALSGDGVANSLQGNLPMFCCDFCDTRLAHETPEKAGSEHDLQKDTSDSTFCSCRGDNPQSPSCSPPQPTPRKQLPILHPQDAKSKLLPPRTMPVGPAAEMSSPTGVHMPATARRSRMRPPARGHSGAHPFRHGLCRKTRQAGRPLCQPCVPCSA